MANPQVRAAMVKDLLGLLRAGKVPRGAEILGLAEPELIARVDESTRLEWLPSPPIAQLADEARALLGGPLPLVLDQAHRNYGTIDVTSTGPHAATLRIRGCPPEGLSHGLLDVFAGTIEGLLASSSLRVAVDVDYVTGSSDAALAVREET